MRRHRKTGTDRFRQRVIGSLEELGPGLVTGAADDDPSGIATYSQAGAAFGPVLLWTMVLTYPLMSAVQLISARIGRVTGRGLAWNLRRVMPRWVVVGRSRDQTGTEFFEEFLERHAVPLTYISGTAFDGRIRFRRNDQSMPAGLGMAAIDTANLSLRRLPQRTRGTEARHDWSYTWRCRTNSSNVGSWRRPRQPASASPCRLPPLRPHERYWSACTT